MANLKGFNANEHDPMKEFSPLPDGEYLAMITESAEKPTSANDGSAYVQLVFTVIDGPYKNRKHYVNLNLKNKNAQAVAIAKSELSSICRALGVMTPNESIELHNLPLKIKIKIKKRKDTGELENRIVAYLPKNAANQQSGPAGNPAPAGAAPWKR